MYSLNKIIGYLISPMGAGMALVAVAVLAHVLRRRRLFRWTALLALAHFWIWSTPILSRWIGATLESEFLVDGRVPSVESLPKADLIELHGGGMGLATNIGYQAEMWANADRVWHAARIWKAGKAPIVYVTSGGTDLSTGPLLADLGVPKEAIVYDFGPRNTEEEAKAVSGFKFQVSSSEPETFNLKPETFNLKPETCNLKPETCNLKPETCNLKPETCNLKPETCNLKPETFHLKPETSRPKVLVVTSAWHMKRTMLMYKKYAPRVEAIPAPCDFENTLGAGRAGGWKCFLPDPAAFMGNSVAFHEWLGYWGYKLFR